jgi:hypothetical protein
MRVYSRAEAFLLMLLSGRARIFALTILSGVALSAGIAACEAGKGGSNFDDNDDSNGGENPGGMGGNGGTAGGHAGFNPGNGGSDAGMGGIPINPCGSECGPDELCDAPGIAKDDDCDGEVDEGCPCTSGQQHGCFKGDPSYLGTEGCFPGEQSCTELGVWGECTGGVHATEMCFMGGAIGCHAISTRPFVPKDLMEGTGNASLGGSTHTFNVTCPAGVSPCPTPNMTDYTPLQSGEYTVEYIKDGTAECTFPLFVGAPGLRVELSWDYNSVDDVDLHLHKPMDTMPWGGTSGNEYDCAYNNCTAGSYEFGFGIEWWAGSAPPDPPPAMPVAWTYDPVVMENNTCYYGPKGNGLQWQGIGMGCHNPRLDIDNITCSPGITDPQNSSFCNPENINVDAPPKNEWFRVGVHYYLDHGGGSTPMMPEVKIFCDGAPAASLGAAGFAAPVSFPVSESNTGYWLVADVLFLPADECGTGGCVVEPLYGDSPTNTQPLKTTASAVSSSFTPPYLPVPMP